MLKRSLFSFFAAAALAACVPTSKYQQVQSASKDRQNTIDQLNVKIDQLRSQIQQLKSDLNQQNASQDQLAQDTALAGIRNRTLQNRLSVLENDLQSMAAKMGETPEYRALMQHLAQMQDELATSEDKRISSENAVDAQKQLVAEANNALAESERQLQQSNADLQAKSLLVESQQSALADAQKDIERQAARLREMESQLAAKDSAMAQLRNRIANALADFSSDELTVVHKDGMVYVSLEEKLLFESGKYDVNNKGVSAIRQIASVIKNVGDQMYIMVEGHTDNVPLRGTVIEDNWDLSAKRATSVLRILVAGGVDRSRVQATGRADTDPVASNDSDEGRRKNRRTEIILAPKIDQILKAL